VEGVGDPSRKTGAKVYFGPKEHIMRKKLGLASAVVGASALLAACGFNISIAFDTTGLYEGAWGVTLEGTEIGPCPIAFDLKQNAGARFPDNLTVKGTATINFECFTFGQSVIPARTLEVSGLMEPSGQVFLASPDILSACPEGETCVKIALEGTGVDDNGDGMMDRIEGSFILTLQQGNTPIPAIGTFSAEVATE